MFSTYVEVILNHAHIRYLKPCVLHVCGGDPKSPLFFKNINQCSPRMWRWSLRLEQEEEEREVFSTYVEVIPFGTCIWVASYSVLHVCGGDPKWLPKSILSPWCSPRMWRWSYTPEHFAWLKAVFSTYVEVIPRSVQKLSLNRRVLHVCGGDPIPNDSTIIMIRCSPRMWRWSYSGRMVNLWFVRVLHVCGGDPKPTGGGYDSTQCSPRMWRWSPPWVAVCCRSSVFSTYVEVILRSRFI